MKMILDVQMINDYKPINHFTIVHLNSTKNERFLLTFTEVEYQLKRDSKPEKVFYTFSVKKRQKRGPKKDPPF